jgi:hypothetical protein
VETFKFIVQQYCENNNNYIIVLKHFKQANNYFGNVEIIPEYYSIVSDIEEIFNINIKDTILENGGKLNDYPHARQYFFTFDSKAIARKCARKLNDIYVPILELMN